MNFTGSEDPVLSQPFTVVDPAGSVWTIATDKIWLVAVKGKGSAPRFRGDFSGLNILLKLLRLEPTDGVEFDKAEALKRLDADGIGRVLGIAVSMKRLRDLLIGIPEEKLLAWDASVIGPPALGLTCDGWRAFLMGFEDAGEVEEFSLVSTSRHLFDLAMAFDEA